MGVQANVYFRGNEDLCKLGKEYLNALLSKFVVYSLQHSETFDVSHIFLPLTNAELSKLKQVRFFGPPCTCTWVSEYVSKQIYTALIA